MTWQQTYDKWLSGIDVKKLLPKVTFYNHRAVIMRNHAVDISKKNFDLIDEIQKLEASINQPMTERS